MTIQEITLKLTTKFPRFLKEDDDELDDILDSLKEYSESDLSTIWAEFRDTWTAGYSPRRGHFVKIASSLNLKRYTGSVTEYIHVCYICASETPEHTFPIDVWPCPRCGNADRPYYAVARRGAFVSKEYAETVLLQHPKGPHPVYGIKAPLKNKPLGGVTEKWRANA